MQWRVTKKFDWQTKVVRYESCVIKTVLSRRPAFWNAGWREKCRPAFWNAGYKNEMPAGSESAGRLFFAAENAGFAIFDGEYHKKASANSNNQPTTRKSIVRSADNTSVLHVKCIQRNVGGG
jgi:hypothetical protein